MNRMDFSIEFYETADGHSPVEEFLDDLKTSDPDVHAKLLVGLAKLRDRHNHREPRTWSPQRARAVVLSTRAPDHCGTRYEA
jgi:hypothetical protein